MSWEDLKPKRLHTQKYAAKDLTVMVSSNGADSKFWHWLQISVRAARLREYPSLTWVKPKARLKVQTGTGDQSRRIRITEGEDWQFSNEAAGGRESGELCYVRLPAFPNQLKPSFCAQKVWWDVIDGALVVELPEWCFGQLGDAGKGAGPVGRVQAPPMDVRAPTLQEQARASLLPPAIAGGGAGAAAAPAQGMPYKLGAPSHAQVNKMRGVAGSGLRHGGV